MLTVLDLDVRRRFGGGRGTPPEVVERVDPTFVPWIPLLGILLGLDLPPTTETASLDERFLRERLADVAMRLLVSTLAGTRHHARRRGRPAHRRGEHRSPAAPLRGRSRPAPGAPRDTLGPDHHVGADGRRRAAVARAHTPAAARARCGGDRAGRNGRPSRCRRTTSTRSPGGVRAMRCFSSSSSTWCAPPAPSKRSPTPSSR